MVYRGVACIGTYAANTFGRFILTRRSWPQRGPSLNDPDLWTITSLGASTLGDLDGDDFEPLPPWVDFEDALREAGGNRKLARQIYWGRREMHYGNKHFGPLLVWDDIRAAAA